MSRDDALAPRGPGGQDPTMCPTRQLLVHSASPEATEALAQALGRCARPGLVLGLVGEMGAGKTAFVRGFARGLDVQEPVSSPTFTLMQELEGRHPLWHYDAWMVEREVAFLEGGGADFLGGDGVAVVEWADRVEEWLPRPYLRVSLRVPPASGRKADPVPPTTRWLLLEALDAGSTGELSALLEGLEPLLEGQEGLELVPAYAWSASEPPTEAR